MKRGAGGDTRAMTHFANALCATILIYGTVTRGGLGVARILERLIGD